jgi:phosphoribosylglycinamide formyltransferase-1
MRIPALKRPAPRLVVKKTKAMSPEEYGSGCCPCSVKTPSIRGAGRVLTILPANFIKAYEGRIINVHPSLIPSFCGAGYYGLKVHEAALAYGVKVTGATVHYVNEIPDGGRIIAQKAVNVLPGDTPETLQRRVMEEAEWQLLPRAVEHAASTGKNRGANAT